MDYILCSQRSCGKYVFERYLNHEWAFASSLEELEALLEIEDPHYIFFLHWSDIVPDHIVDNYDCICFHPSNLPAGRGGTPVQNQIKDGYIYTHLTAFKMTHELDAGPIYLQEYLSLDGTAEEIYLTMAEIAVDMIDEIISEAIQPVEQHGFVSKYKRRTPAQSEMTVSNLSKTFSPDLRDVFDHIRMLDAEDYPKAYIEKDGFRYTFSRPTLRVGKVVCDVEITEI